MIVIAPEHGPDFQSPLRKAMTATQYLLRAKEVGDRVAVIGGG
jgi:preprotein translocase subunit YajC